MQLDTDWDTSTILNSVGFNEHSISLYSRYLAGLNAYRPAANQKTEDEQCRKLLAAVAQSGVVESMAHEAKKELRRANQFVYPAGHANAGQRNFQMIVTFFNDLWRSNFKDGNIRAKARTANAAAGTQRLDDGIAVAGADDDDEEDGALAVFRRNFVRGPPVALADLGMP